MKSEPPSYPTAALNVRSACVSRLTLLLRGGLRTLRARSILRRVLGLGGLWLPLRSPLALVRGLILRYLSLLWGLRSFADGNTPPAIEVLLRLGQVADQDAVAEIAAHILFVHVLRQGEHPLEIAEPTFAPMIL